MMARAARRERTPLTPRAVVEAALAKADAGGLEAISFRRLATDLGVTPMALYRYFDGKQALLSAMAERVFEDFELPRHQEDWREQLRELARSFRRLLVAHPAVAALLSTRPVEISPNAARVVEVLLCVLRRAGFSVQEAALLQSELERFVLALVMLETRGGTPPPTEQEQRARIRGIRVRLAALPPEDFPNLVVAAPYLCEQSNPDRAFEFALDLIHGGLERLLERRETSRQSSPPETQGPDAT